MKNWSKLAFLFLLIVCISWITSSCIKKKDYPVIPNIKFEYLSRTPDSVNIVISFTDGDGDVGNIMTQDSTTTSLFIEYYELRNNIWHHIIADSLAVPYYYVIPSVTPNSKNKTLEGEIDVKLESYFNPFTPYDTIKYTVQLFDRALNRSNIVETNSIIVVKK